MQHKTLSEFWQEAKEIITERRKRGIPEFPTGITFIDSLTNGMQKGEIWIIAGKTGSGKTSLALQMASSFADNPQHSILFLSLEMKGWQLALRLFSERMQEVYGDLLHGYEDIHLEKDYMFNRWLDEVDFEIVEYGYTFQEIEKMFVELYENKHPDIIFIDYMQLIEWKQWGDERIAIAEYVRKLQELAKRHNVGVVIVSQIRRLPTGADYNRPPDLYDLKGSGSLEQTADKVFLIYKETEKGAAYPRHYIHLAKSRDSETMCKEVRFIGAESRFEDSIQSEPRPIFIEAPKAKNRYGEE